MYSLMDFFCTWCKSTRTLNGRTVIITGSNTGIGKETALDLYKRGARVIMACRNKKMAEEAKDAILKQTMENECVGEIIIEELDLSSLKSVKEFTMKMLANEKNIDILINNAGVMMCPEGKTKDGFETHIGVNHFGHALLTLLLLPRIIKSDHPRVVTVSSVMHSLSEMHLDDINMERVPYSPIKAYSRSKAANVLFSRALHLKLRSFNIENVNTYSLHPGVVQTSIGRHFNSTVVKGGTWLFNNIYGWFIRSPRCGAQTTIYCAVHEACDTESGLYYDDCRIVSTSKQCQDDSTALKLWDLTVEKLNLKNYNPFGSLDPDIKNIF